jgi:hypothetical protein
MEVSKLAEMTQKECMSFINEVYNDELKAYTKKFNELKEEDRWQIGAAFCAFASDLPKRKALYCSFLERQDCKDPKDYKNVLRFLNEMKIKTEFQSN